MNFHYLSRVNFYAMFDEYGQMLFTSHTNNGFEKVYSLDIPTSNKVTFYEKFGTAVCLCYCYDYKKERKENEINSI